MLIVIAVVVAVVVVTVTVALVAAVVVAAVACCCCCFSFLLLLLLQLLLLLRLLLPLLMLLFLLLLLVCYSCSSYYFKFPSRNITPERSGKYIVELFYPERRVNSFQIIVQERPSIRTDCMNMTINEGENLTCICKATSKDLSALKWSGDKPGEIYNFTDILILENVSRNDSGTYTCAPINRTFKYQVSFNLQVVPNISIPVSKHVQIEYFSVLRNMSLGSRKIIISCKAKGIPKPTYEISHNGIVKNDSTYIVEEGNVASLGKYECLAKNGESSDRSSLHLNSTVFESKHNLQRRMDLKTMLIAGGCSFAAGTLFACFLACFCKNCGKKKNEKTNTDYDDVVPRWDISKYEDAQGTENENGEIELDRLGDEESRNSAEYDLPLNAENSCHPFHYNEYKNDRFYYNEYENSQVYYKESCFQELM